MGCEFSQYVVVLVQTVETLDLRAFALKTPATIHSSRLSPLTIHADTRIAPLRKVFAIRSLNRVADDPQTHLFLLLPEAMGQLPLSHFEPRLGVAARLLYRWTTARGALKKSKEAKANGQGGEGSFSDF